MYYSSACHHCALRTTVRVSRKNLLFNCKKSYHIVKPGSPDGSGRGLSRSKHSAQCGPSIYLQLLIKRCLICLFKGFYNMICCMTKVGKVAPPQTLLSNSPPLCLSSLFLSLVLGASRLACLSVVFPSV